MRAGRGLFTSRELTRRMIRPVICHQCVKATARLSHAGSYITSCFYSCQTNALSYTKCTKHKIFENIKRKQYSRYKAGMVPKQTFKAATRQLQLNSSDTISKNCLPITLGHHGAIFKNQHFHNTLTNLSTLLFPHCP